jgi:DNA-binding CsgD family transcriptional regulator
MASIDKQIRVPAGATRPASSGDLTAFLMALCGQIGADNYMLVAVINDSDRSDLRIIASNWVYDAVQLVGPQLIGAIVRSEHAVPPGCRPRAITTYEAPSLPGVLSGEDARLLDVLGHGEIYPLRLHVGRQKLYVLFSTEMPGRLVAEDLMRAQMRCCYVLSQVPDLIAETAQQDPLSDRERECLYWVSEGKTTEDVALILGVSANTVNGYVTHAMQKFSASNRAMAVATAIRSGII